MSNGYYTSHRAGINWPAPKNKGGYNASQLSLQKSIQENVANFNASIREAKTFGNAPEFSDHVKDFWGIKINEYSDAQNSYVAGDSSATDSKKAQEDINALWKSWTTVAPYLAALGEEVHRYGLAGELDKLNDPNLEALLSHMQRNDGSVTLQNDGNKLYLTGKGEIDEKNINGENTGNKLPWEYDLDIDAFLQIIGVNTYESEAAGNETAIYNNLNKIISRRATGEDFDLDSTIEAAKTQSSTGWNIPVIDRKGKETGVEKLNFVYEDLLRFNLNYGGLPNNFGSGDMGNTKWVGTAAKPALMNADTFDSYYANVLYNDYQPHYNEKSEIDWLIDYDDNGNEIDRVRPWNIADESIWIPTRDKLTENAMTNATSVNQALMVRLNEDYKLILDEEYGGDMRKFMNAKDIDGIKPKYDVGGNPWEYYTGINEFAEQKWQEAKEYNQVQNQEDNDDDDPPIILGNVKTKEICEKEGKVFDTNSKQCIPKHRYGIENAISLANYRGINKNVSIEEITNDINNTPITVEGIAEPITLKNYIMGIKGSDGRALNTIIGESDNGEILLTISQPQGDEFRKNRWHLKGKNMEKVIDINFNTHKTISKVIDNILFELKEIGAQKI